MTNNFTQQATHFLSCYGRIKPIEFDTPFLLLSVEDSSLLFHLITLPHVVTDPFFFQNMTLHFEQQGYQIIHLWEDRWRQQQTLLQQSINYRFGHAQRIFARHTTVNRIDTSIALNFLTQNHVLSGTNCRYHFGLYYQEQLVSVASFSNRRMLTYTLPHRTSYEWVRYSTLSNITVVGGLSKMLKTFIRHKQPDHIMTYCDMDFSMASGFQKVGFKIVQIMPPLMFSIDKDLRRNYKISSENAIRYYTTGNLKLEFDSMSFR